jgi:hypothetical protein|tara:strand:+ start:1885 stop:2235 length:351 start_codon:yes stop_codon:yes gene_type:complete
MRGLSQELGFIYITSTGEKYVDRQAAINRQGQIDMATESKEIIKRRKQMEADEVLKILEDNGWAVFYKANPIHHLSVQNATPIFSVNAVSKEELLRAFTSNQKGDDKWHSETDSNQ